MLRTVELHAQPVGDSLRLARAGEAEGPVGEMRTFSVTVPVKLRLPRWIDVVVLL